jgi:hypothetical protein
MHEIIKPAQDIFYMVANGDNSVFHYGVVLPTQRMTTGLGEIETFLDCESLIAHGSELGLELQEQDIM